MTRAHAPGYTYWDYYRQRFEREARGLKIDFVVASPSLASRVTGAFIDKDERDPAQGTGSPSDHAPVVVDLSSSPVHDRGGGRRAPPVCGTRRMRAYDMTAASMQSPPARNQARS